jgi:PIN domain nuclease of toxin-antitoxin system
VRLLLDTHALIWWLAGDESLSHAARDAIADDANEAFVSAVSAMEVSTKYRIGKLPGAARLAQDFEAIVASQGFLELPLTIRHARIAGGLQGAHKDPFDRMLIAQALSEDVVLVSNELLFDAFGVSRLW